jgi:hypothetical protein
MIRKIISIKNVGRFENCAWRGGAQFESMGLIYAENGRGKSTFCDVLRSLQTAAATSYWGANASERPATLRLLFLQMAMPKSHSKLVPGTPQNPKSQFSIHASCMKMFMLVTALTTTTRRIYTASS